MTFLWEDCQREVSQWGKVWYTVFNHVNTTSTEESLETRINMKAKWRAVLAGGAVAACILAGAGKTNVQAEVKNGAYLEDDGWNCYVDGEIRTDYNGWIEDAVTGSQYWFDDGVRAESKEIYFTSGGSESDNTALNGIANLKKKNGKHIITSRIEHPAILETCKKLEEDGYKISYLNVDENGLINLGELANIINDETILISIMFANNEIGTIQQIEKIAQIAHSKDIIFHTDAVQAVGNIKIDVKKMGIDMLSLSSHKIYGPKGVGALYVKNGIDFERFINGGHQEKNKRAGTENVAGIVGFGEAGEIISRNLDKHIAHLRELRDYYLEEVSSKIKNIKIN